MYARPAGGNLVSVAAVRFIGDRRRPDFDMLLVDAQGVPSDGASYLADSRTGNL